MPVDLEMLLSATPPLYAYSSFSSNRYNGHEYASDYNNNDYTPTYPKRKKNYLSRQDFQQHLRCSEFLPPLKQLQYYSINSPDSKNCNSTDSTESGTSDSTYDRQHEGNKQREKKKKVSFADDKGLALVEIRSIPETVNYAPKWTEKFFSVLTEDVKPAIPPKKVWKPMFSDPPYTSSALRQRLENHEVALEKVSINEESDEISGIIKVKNNSFEKEVFLRITFDRWISSTDVPATYSSTENSESSNSYDTFHFSTVIPPSALRYEVVEFCVCYKHNEQENWDNNGGINYRLVTATPEKTSVAAKSASVLTVSKSKCEEPCMYTLSLTENLNDCPEIAWNQLMIDRPYW